MGSDGRWGQLSYASFDTGEGGGGGWRIKETSGDLTPAEIESLRARVVTAFQPAEPLAPFPTPAQIDEQPRRLVYGPVESTPAWAYWHAVPSGTDGTGRPGNVFSHVLLDRRPYDEEPALRPITTWRSGWLAPFGPHQVVEARLPAAPPSTGSVVARDRVLAFLLDAAVWRAGLFAVLLDAVLTVPETGRPVVLVTDSVENAALWTGALSFFMSPGTSRRMGFSLFERAEALADAERHGLALVCIPRADLPALTGGPGHADLVVIDESEAPQLGDLGGEPHRTAFGSSIEVTPWSVMAQVVLIDEAAAERALELLDDVAARVGDVGLRAAWPLALVVALSADEFEDATGEAAVVLRDQSPDSLGQHADYWGAASLLTRDLFGASAAEVWAQLQAGSASGASAMNLAKAVYVERALGEPGWLRQRGGAPVPSGLATGPGSRLAGLAGQALERSRLRFDESEQTDDDVVDLIVLLDFLARAGLLPALDRGSHTDVLVERFVAPRLIGDQSTMFVGLCGPVSPQLSAELLLPVLESINELHDRPPGGVLTPQVLAWLFPGEWEPLASDSATPDGLSFLQREFVIWRCRQGHAASVAALRPAAVLSALGTGRAAGTTAVSDLTSPNPRWSVADVVWMEHHRARSLPPGVVVDVLLTATSIDEAMPLTSLYREKAVEGDGYDQVVALADVFRLARDFEASWDDSLATPTAATMTADSLVRSLRPFTRAELPADALQALVTPVAVALLLLLVTQPASYDYGTYLVPQLAARLSESTTRLPASTVEQTFSGFFRRNALSEKHLASVVEVAVRGSDGSELAFLGRARSAISRFETRLPGDTERAADIILRTLLALVIPDEDQLADAAARRILAATPDAPYRQSELTKSITAYLRQLDPDRAGSTKGLLGRLGGLIPNRNEEN